MSNLLLTIPTSSQGGNNGRPRLRVPRLPRPLQSSSLHQPVRPLLSTCSTTARHCSSICMRSSGAVHARPVRTVYTKCGENSARFEPEFSSHLMFTGFFRLFLHTDLYVLYADLCAACAALHQPVRRALCSLRPKDHRKDPWIWLKNQPA